MAPVPELFRLHRQAAVPNPPAPRLDTPLGAIVLGVSVSGAEVAPVAAYQGARDLFVWDGPARVELLLTAPALALPPGMVVAGARAAVWRVRPRGFGPVILRCAWAVGARGSAAGPESGENLDAQTWTDGRVKVTVGLPDLGAATEYRPDGFAVTVPEAPDTFQTHFVCAWGPEVADDVSTWFAVDCTPEQLRIDAG